MFMKIIVTGASGFIGTNLVKYLKKKSHHVIAICDHTCEAGDIADYVYYTGLLGLQEKHAKLWKADAIVHLSANNDTLCEDVTQMIDHNFVASKKMYELAKTINCSHFIYTSSMAVYGNNSDNKEDPLNAYASSKLLFDNFIKDQLDKDKIKTISLRLSNVYGQYENEKGRRMSYLGQMLQNMIANKDVKLFKEVNAKRDWVYVEDVCDAIYKSLKSKSNGIYNIGSGTTISFMDLFKKLADVTGYKKLPKLIANKKIESYQSIENNDISLAIKHLKYKPKYSIDCGIKKYYSILKKNYLAIS